MPRGMLIVAVAVLAQLVACASVPTPAERSDHARQLAAERHWQGTTIATGTFELMSAAPASLVQGAVLTIYIEGDGLAWVSRHKASDDPTPRDPLALQMALAQPEGAAAYLARPCQYVGSTSPHCERAYWTGRRFAEEVVASTSSAIDTLKQRASARSVILVGYSGGGTIAALVAARRHDVERLVTVAANLDVRAWTDAHKLAPLTGSLDPADAVDALARIPQHHFAGADDRVVPPSLTEGYAARFAENTRPTVTVEPGFDHHCCWVEHWPALWREANR